LGIGISECSKVKNKCEWRRGFVGHSKTTYKVCFGRKGGLKSTNYRVIVMYPFTIARYAVARLVLLPKRPGSTNTDRKALLAFPEATSLPYRI
jgi:hypothetical protein